MISVLAYCIIAQQCSISCTKKWNVKCYRYSCTSTCTKLGYMLFTYTSRDFGSLCFLSVMFRNTYVYWLSIALCVLKWCPWIRIHKPRDTEHRYKKNSTVWRIPNIDEILLKSCQQLPLAENQLSMQCSNNCSFHGNGLHRLDAIDPATWNVSCM